MGYCWFYVQNKKFAPATSTFRWKLAVARLARTSWARAAAQNWCAVSSIGKLVEVALVFDADIRVCFHSWQRKPSLDRSHRCLFLANLDHKGPICLVRSVCWHTLYKRKNLLTLLSMFLLFNSCAITLRYFKRDMSASASVYFDVKGQEVPKVKIVQAFSNAAKVKFIAVVKSSLPDLNLEWSGKQMDEDGNLTYFHTSWPLFIIDISGLFINITKVKRALWLVNYPFTIETNIYHLW